jgi:uncharacterized membrane protein
MTFLNFVLLGGLAAASIPLIIHLLNRNRFRVVKWGAMHLLETAFQMQRKRIQLEQLLLLLLRCAIPAVLALCLARPVITGMQALMGGAKTSTVILLDNSYSMDFGGRAGGNYTQARQAAARIVEASPRGSDVAVLLMAGGLQPLANGPTFDLGRLSKELAGLEGGYGKADVAAAVEASSGLLSSMQHSHQEVIVLSDFQRVSWSDDDAPARTRAVELLQSLPLKPRLTLFPIGSEGRDNVAVESLDYNRFVLGVGQPMQVRATLRNFGERSYPDLRVFFRVDGRERSASQIALGPNEQQQVLFTHAFDSAGSHVIEVFAEADSLEADNSYQASIPVWDQVPVLLINGDPAPGPLQGETDYLDIALQPFGAAKMNLSDLIVTRVGTLNELNAASLARHRVVVLANVRELTDAQVRDLAQFVRDGGGLLVFPGSRVNLDAYRRNFATSEGLLPFAYAALTGSSDPNSPPARIVSSHYSHPALELFNDPRNGNLADGEIKLWYKSTERTNDAAITVLARLDNGDPFLVEKKFGEGRVLQCATACDADWNNLPLRPFYVPLTQRLVTYLASSVFPPRNVEIGKPLVAFLDKSLAGKRATLIDAAGAQHELPVIGKDARAVVEFTATQRPGLYKLMAPGAEPIHFVVNTTREESDLKTLGATERESVARAMGATLVRSYEEYRQLDQQRRFGQEIWRPLFWLLLALLFGELLFQQWIGRRRPVSATTGKSAGLQTGELAGSVRTSARETARHV